MESGSRPSLFAPQGSSPLKRVFFLGFLNRRKFLKYAGATGAVVGASALGLNYISTQSPSTPSPIASTTVTRELASISASSSTSTQVVQLASLQGRLFFDLNGNSIQESEEQGVPNVKVQLRDQKTGGMISSSITDSSGDYKMQDFPAGTYLFEVTEADPKFGYMCNGVDDFRRVDEGYPNLTVTENGTPFRSDGKWNIGLMEGFMTLPVMSKTKYSIGRFYDWEPDPKRSLWWNGRIGDDPYNHVGIDFDTREGENVVAPAPGFLYPIERGPYGQLPLGLYHPDAGLATVYNHLSKVVDKTAVKGFVTRGEKIAETGSTGASYPHLHFGTAMKIGDHDAFFDPYRPLFALNEKNNGYWARQQGNDFWQTVPAGVNPNLENLWTKDNDPQYAIK